MPGHHSGTTQTADIDDPCGAEKGGRAHLPAEYGDWASEPIMLDPPPLAVDSAKLRANLQSAGLT